MKTTVLFFGFILISIFGTAQNSGIYAGYVIERPNPDYLFQQRGIRLGLSTMPKQFETLPYKSSMN